MAAVFFLYTIVFIVLLIFASSMSFASWLMTRRRVDLCAVVVFLACILDLAFVMFDEYTRTKLTNPVMFETALSHPIERLILTIFMVSSCWIWTLVRTYSDRHRSRFACILFAWVLIELALLPYSESTSALHQFAFWAWRDCALIACPLYCLWRMRVEENEVRRHVLAHIKRACIVALGLLSCVLAEDAFIILFHQPDLSNGFMRELSWHLAGRNISENILFLFLAIASLSETCQTFRLQYVHPPVLADVNASPTSESSIKNRIAVFCDTYEMSERERDVVNEVLSGKNIKETASALFISSGTVRAHLHHIYKKTGSEGKDDLIERFWSSGR